MISKKFSFLLSKYEDIINLDLVLSDLRHIPPVNRNEGNDLT